MDDMSTLRPMRQPDADTHAARIDGISALVIDKIDATCEACQHTYLNSLCNGGRYCPLDKLTAALAGDS
jgi:hypothetical protein